MGKLLLILLSVLAFGYEAKVEPFNEFKIKASVAGEIVKSNKNLEAKNVKNALIVKIDDRQDLIDLNNLQRQYKILKLQIDNQKEIVKRKENVYKKYETLKTKSQSEKDLKFYDYINAQNQLLNLQNQLSNIKASIEKLKDVISKKNIKVSGYVYSVNVQKGDYVAPGVLVAEVYDLSRQKLDIYVPIDEINIIKNKKIYINGKMSNFKIYKIWKLPDTKYITSYKVELTGEGLKFGDIVKISFK